MRLHALDEIRPASTPESPSDDSGPSLALMSALAEPSLKCMCCYASQDDQESRLPGDERGPPMEASIHKNKYFRAVLTPYLSA